MAAESCISEKIIKMKESFFHRVIKNTSTRFWVNNPTIKEAQLAIEAGTESCTTNPTYASKMLVRPEMAEISRKALVKVAKEEADDSLAAAAVQAILVQKIMAVFADVHKSSGGTKGWISLQGNPEKEGDSNRIIREAEAAMKLGPNYIAKIPVTKNGIRAIRSLAAEVVPVISTEVVSLSQATSACETYVDTIRRRKNPAPFIEHIISTVIISEYLPALYTTNNNGMYNPRGIYSG